MADQITPEISDRICSHMNDDHAEAILLYAQVYGNSPAATSAKMVSIDALGMDISAEINESQVPLRVTFDHTLTDSEDAHQTLITMVKQARKISS